MATSAKTGRLDLRLSDEQKRLIEQAAALAGQMVSSFVLSSSLQRAWELIGEANVIKLSAEDRDRFLAVLGDANAKPGAALLRAARRYKAILG
jgi:uncharacterized protein (DUF1778 family)